jgi:hypothetical protein
MLLFARGAAGEADLQNATDTDLVGYVDRQR